MPDHVTDSWVRSFRVLYSFRAGFSLAWIALVSALASSAAPGGSPGVLAGILLACYPVSDAVATVDDLRANHTARARWPQQVNLVAGVAAAWGILITRAGLSAWCPRRQIPAISPPRRRPPGQTRGGPQSATPVSVGH